MARPMSLGESLEKDRVRCLACAHRCIIPPGAKGVCKVRFNTDGVLMGPWGYVAGLQDDPIEKKPFFHAYPGARALSFGMLGCDFHCPYCQNWTTSQAPREGLSSGWHPITPHQIVAQAKAQNALILTSTYNEPLITSEWAQAVFSTGAPLGLVGAYVSNGNNTPEVIEFLKPHVSLYNVDLKSFQDKNYRKLGGTLQGVLDGIERVYKAGMWMEVITLVVPGFNDSEEELGQMAGFIAELSTDIPWHATAFHPDYRMTDPPPTPPGLLMRAYELGRGAGLKFVYTGNLPGRVGETENTRCPNCDETLVARRGFQVRAYHLKDGCCPRCACPIPGRWHTPQTKKNSTLL